MGNHPAIVRARARWVPVFLLLLLVAGAAAHFEHHLLDPDCGSDSRPAHATCQACSALHGGLAAGPAAEAPTLGAPQSPSVLAPVDAAPTSAARRLVSTRAPPVA